MEIPEHRRWMYNRLHPGRSGLKPEFVNGVDDFLSYVCQQPEFIREMLLRCPCCKCKCLKYLEPNTVKVHLYQKGFMERYWYWTYHGEEEPNVEVERAYNVSGSSSNQPDNLNRYQEMIYDSSRPEYYANFEQRMEDTPNADAQKFFDLLNAANRPLWQGSRHSELSVATRIMSIKSDWNVAQQCVDSMVELMRETNPLEDIRIPQSYYEARKLVSKLGLQAMKIDCCANGCMLYYKDDIDELSCKFCQKPRYRPRRVGRGNFKNVAVKSMHYLPLIPRLQRLYASMSSSPHMRWHYENRRPRGVLSHPSDGEAWKHFDRVYPDFAFEPRNIRLGLCSDGFTPFSQSSSSYSCWPVIVTPYNLPPEMCMTKPYMFLTCIIPGPKNPKSLIDVYLQPLIDELKLLWHVGVLTYDVCTKQNFMLRAAIIWTINDFPAYGMLSGWMTAGKLACPYCMERTKAFTLKHGRKNSWFDCHRQFLPCDHVFRRNKRDFIKNRVEIDEPPPRLSGEQVWDRVCSLPKVTEQGRSKLPGYGVYHNWTKQSIFWELPYWKMLLIRHNLDVMHVEKNVFDNIFYTVMDMRLKTKDNIKARIDLAEICRRRDMELVTLPNGKIVKPKAKYSLTVDEKRAVCNWVRELKMPDGFASNLARCFDPQTSNVHGMKSHDCHIFMECLLPIAFDSLPDAVWKPLTELSQFFKDLCSTTLREEDLLQLEQNIPVILCKLERIFPPALFDSMEHLIVHLSYEARVGGPVQYRWMYPFER